MILNSIRWRLQIWYGLFLVAVLVGFGFTAYQLERARVFRGVDDELQRREGFLANALQRASHGGRGQGGPPEGRPFDGPRDDGFTGDGPPAGERFDNGPGGQGPPMPRDFRLPPQQAGMFDETDTNGFYYAIWLRNNQSLARSSNAPAGLSVPARPEFRAPPGGPGHPQPLMHGVFRESVIFTPPGEVIVVGCSIEREMSRLNNAALLLTGVCGAILLLGLAGGWWLASRAIRPIEDISAAAAKISAGDLSHRINVSETESELGRLANVLNSTFSRLDAAFKQQQQFTSDAAHELRTPVSVMLTQAQTALNRERSAPEYRETLESCQRAAQRMRRLIESLLELARLDAGQQPMKRLRMDLAQTTRDSVGLIQPLADARHVKISCDMPALACMGDSDRLSQVITNLLTNAITYNKENGEVRIGGTTKNGSVSLTITDTGVGMSAEDLSHLFERFYRADKSRTSGNTGLGLAISKAIVEAHGGTIEVDSKLDEGTSFTVRLPSAV